MKVWSISVAKITKHHYNLAKLKLINVIVLFLPVGVSDLSSQHWVPFSVQAVTTLYRLAEHPDQICGDIIKQLAAVIIKGDEQDGNAGKHVKCKGVKMAARAIALHSGLNQFPF